MSEKLLSRKFILTVVGILVVAGICLAKDLETVKWLGGFIAGIIGSYNVGQGIADSKKSSTS